MLGDDPSGAKALMAEVCNPTFTGEEIAKMGEGKKKVRTGPICGGCRWCATLNDSRGRCRRYPPSIPGETPADPFRYLTVDLDAPRCGEWKPPQGSR